MGVKPNVVELPVDRDAEEQVRVTKLARCLAEDLITTTDRLIRSTCCDEDYQPTMLLFLEAVQKQAMLREFELRR